MIFSSSQENLLVFRLFNIAVVGILKNFLEKNKPLTTDSLDTFLRIQKFMQKQEKFDIFDEYLQNEFNDITKVKIILWKEGPSSNAAVVSTADTKLLEQMYSTICK